MGFLHRDRPGRTTLALDLMEELRAPLCDRVALSLINRRQLARPKDLRTLDGRRGGPDRRGQKARADRMAGAQATRSASTPGWANACPFGLVPWLQAQILARHLRGDVDAYPPWLWG